MLESFVSILGLPCLGGPGFSSRSVRTSIALIADNYHLCKNLFRLT